MDEIALLENLLNLYSPSGQEAEAVTYLVEQMRGLGFEARVDEAGKIISDLKKEQARGCFEIARFYEKYKKWSAARVYYGQIQIVDPHSPYADEARVRIDAINKRLSTAGK